MAAVKIQRLRELMKKHSMDAYITADSDPHSSEYPAAHWKTRSWLSGFTGSNGVIAVTLDEAALWTDGRYYIQADRQLKDSGIALMRAGEPGVPGYPAWLADRLGAQSTVGVNGMATSCAAYGELVKAFAGRGTPVDIGRDLVGELWDESRPSVPGAPIFCHDIRYTGKCAADKITGIRAALARRGAAYTLIAGLEDVAWLFNIRGSDIPNLPVAYAYAFISPGAAELYIDPEKATQDVIDQLAQQGVCVFDAALTAARLEGLHQGDCISIDPNKVSIWLRRKIPDGVRIVEADEPTLAAKAIKTGAELQGHRDCQLWDGAAMARFLMWVEAGARSGEDISEWDAVVALRRFRGQCAENRGDSFDAIAGYGPNGAMMHYAPAADAAAKIHNAGLMVVDSGGQYPGGTTDITRTVVFDEVTDEERRDFTLTLKSHIALASARFLYGATGGQIDSIARKVMWDHGLDYKCGTGHGVGAYLSVHEGPQSISMRAAATGVRLEENMIVSIEPGVYREGKHGVRIENLARIVEDYTNGFGRFMRFETLSFCPISLNGIEPGLLSGAEREWLNSYHRAVYEKIAPLLDEAERKWLAHATREV